MTVGLYLGDCLDVMAGMPENSVDSVITDPPYGLKFMGKDWDHGVPGVPFWEEALRVAKPGAMLMAFGGTRTHHRLMVAIEDAGWILRDTVMWVYGQGFPKSADISKHLDRQERNKWLKISKALDSLGVADILGLWKEYSSNAKSAGLQFAKSTIETGTSTEGRDFVLGPVLLSINLEKPNAHAIIAELSLYDARLISEADTPSVQHNVEVITGRLNELVKYADKSSEGPRANADTPTFTVPCNVRDWPSGSMVGNLKGAEALRIWLGSKKSSKRAPTIVLCAALTDDLKHIMLSRSKTFLNLDMIRQMDFVSATSVTITESIAECLITFTADTLRNKAIDKAAGAEREVVGRSQYASRRPNPMNGTVYDYNAQGYDISANLDVTAPATDLARTWDGWGTALKPAWEPIILAMAPLDGTFAQNAEKWGVAGLWIDGARVPTNGDSLGGGMVSMGRPKVSEGWDRPWMHDPEVTEAKKVESAAKVQHAERLGRFPANLIHDGGDEVVGLFPVTKSGMMKPGQQRVATIGGGGYHGNMPDEATANGTYGDSGSAARFFYCAKASRKERNAGLEGMEEREHHSTQRTEILVCQCGNKTLGNTWPSCPKCGADMRNGTRKQRRGLKAQNHHPTVKPLALMEYLCKLTRTPTGGTVLDPFMGSGSTGCACVKTARDFIGIEIDPDYFEIAEARIAHAQREPQQAEMEIG